LFNQNLQENDGDEQFPNRMNNTVLLLEGAQGISMFTANVRFNYTELYGYNELNASYRMILYIPYSVLGRYHCELTTKFWLKTPPEHLFVRVVLK